MNCPECNTPDVESYRFCPKCGHKISDLPPVQPPPMPPPVSYESSLKPEFLAGWMGIIGGGLTIIGWLMPWIGLGGLGSLLGMVGGSSPYLNLGIGNGLQVALAGVTAGFLALFSGEGSIAFLGFMLLIITACFIMIAVFAGLNIRSGVRQLEIKWNDPIKRAANKYAYESYLRTVRGRTTFALTFLIILFLILTAIPFVSAALGSGFYLTLLTNIAIYGAILYLKTKIN